MDGTLQVIAISASASVVPRQIKLHETPTTILYHDFHNVLVVACLISNLTNPHAATDAEILDAKRSLASKCLLKLIDPQTYTFSLFFLFFFFFTISTYHVNFVIVVKIVRSTF